MARRARTTTSTLGESTAAPPAGDQWGPGTRIPAIIVSPWARKGFVDHTAYDTTSILATIEHRWDVDPLGPRDARVNDLRNAFLGDGRGPGRGDEPTDQLAAP